MVNSHTTSEQFQAYYLQRATMELAQDLDALRRADDFAMTSVSAGGSGGQRTQAAAASKNGSAAAAAASAGQDETSPGAAAAAAPASSSSSSVPLDTPLQMLIEALRQGAEMFDKEDQKRVVAAAE